MTVLDYNKIFSRSRRRTRRSGPKITQDIYRRAVVYSLKSRKAKLSKIFQLKNTQSTSLSNDRPAFDSLEPSCSRPNEGEVAVYNTKTELEVGYNAPYTGQIHFPQPSSSIPGLQTPSMDIDDSFYDPQFPILSYLLNNPYGYLPPDMLHLYPPPSQKYQVIPIPT
ncbi:unnamed protein product [Rodentolepis nana]|uniref:MADS-box domain-containing protein n=1 Tax=Rodentolepis nana TaxID=102285 RepID=A0A0R3TR33_RODNA|nr:unnamed protein product [Rodentolepis nana]